MWFLSTDFNNKLHPLCILQYVYPDDPVINGKPHKNSKKGSHGPSFNRCKKSVLIKIKDQATNSSKPTNVYNKVFVECGGKVWNSKEMYARSSSEAQFHSWFTKYQAQNMKEKMLKPLRQAAGLGQIPAEYTNNPNESTNARIKEKVD